ncbi:hypothetical protein [Cupriavidus malaysiensis]|uniref:Uncharacterized protein n=1 Tax=Cupriavidus malaysiensis TaxID=367825 RepID=A0A1D9I8Y3_9BURK|nr:hypothetical protein [Cupriavidus malaysiensis]AOZ08582.1 hypothetical protein BKK80_21800 [Cupriavidus malaysiensis]
MTFTKTDIALAEVYFPILVDCAIRRQTITYKNLVGQAQGRHPSLIEVQNAIPVSTGRRLDVVKYFCETLGLPDLAGLVVNGQTDEPGGRYDKRHIAVEVQQEAFDFDWHSKSPEFATYIVAQRKLVTPLVKRKPEEAGKLRYAYYIAHKDELPANIADFRDAIDSLLVEGYEPEDAFEIARTGSATTVDSPADR